jgi:hypothetical protein
VGTVRTIQGFAESGEEIALRFALRWHGWQPRTRLRLIRCNSHCNLVVVRARKRIGRVA